LDLSSRRDWFGQETLMRSRNRKLIGAAGLLALVVFWPLLTLALGHSNLSRYYASGQVIFILVFGLVWLIPAALLIRWMQRPDGGAS
jgi:Kef-type K+ transport system membrane component KefB